MKLMETAVWVSVFENVCAKGGECSVGVSEQVAGVSYRVNVCIVKARFS